MPIYTDALQLPGNQSNGQLLLMMITKGLQKQGTAGFAADMKEIVTINRFKNTEAYVKKFRSCSGD